MNEITIDPLPISSTTLPIAEHSKPVDILRIWLQQGITVFQSRLESMSRQKLRGLGYQDIQKDPDIGLCKFNFGTSHDVSEEDLKNPNLRFTGQGLCGYATYALGEAVTKQFPKAQVTWLNMDVDMTERNNAQPWLSPHHALEVTLPGETPVIMDATYGQVLHTQTMLCTPTDTTGDWYKGMKPEHIQRKPWTQARTDFLEELQHDVIGSNDLSGLSDSFLSNGSPDTVPPSLP